MADAEGSGYFWRGGGYECGKEEVGSILLAIAHAIPACLVLCIVCAGLERVAVCDLLGADIVKEDALWEVHACATRGDSDGRGVGPGGST